LDLRGNGGGTFQTAAQIASLFMADRPVTFAADRAGTRTEFRSEKNRVLTDDPLVVNGARGLRTRTRGHTANKLPPSVADFQKKN
jgi:hypothetical protein